MAFNQFVNAGTSLKMESDKARRYVITGRASGRVTEVVVAAGQAYTVDASAESLRVDAFDVQSEGQHDGGIDFRLTQV